MGVCYSTNKKKSKKSSKKKKTKIKRKNLPSSLRYNVWITYLGIYNTGKCVCCNIQIVTMGNYHCGHINSSYNGGPDTIENLRPICTQCNLSMGTENMEKFMDRVGYKKGSNWNGVKQ